MTKMSSMAKLNITRGSTVNGDLTNYTLSLTLNNIIKNGDYILIDIPTIANPFTLSNTSTQCLSTSVSLLYNLSCTL